MQNIVHGIIVLNNDFKSSIKIIQSLKEETYPWLRANMFSVGETEIPYYYENPVISFSASYKKGEWINFVTKFECLLVQIQFETAKIEFEIEFIGNLNFFWKSKNYKIRNVEKEKMFETEKWLFGFGKRDNFGYIEEISEFEKSLKYPFILDNSFFQKIKSLINELPIGKKQEISIEYCLLENEYYYTMLILLDKKNFIRYGYNTKLENGFKRYNFYIQKLKNIENLSLNIQENIQNL